MSDGRVRQCSDVSRLKHLVISVQSLWKIFENCNDMHAFYPKYDVIVLDEIDSIFSTFGSADTFITASRTTIQTYLSWLLYNAKQIIVCDAGLTQLHLDRIHQLIEQARENYDLHKISTRTHLFFQ